MVDLMKIRTASRGFSGRFAFEPEHDEDRGIGNIADVVSFDDRLVYVPDGFELGDDACYVIAEQLEQHVAEPIAEMLNAVPALLDEIERLRAAPPSEIDRAVEEAFRRDRDEARAALRDLTIAQVALDAENVSLRQAVSHHVAEVERLGGVVGELEREIAVLRRQLAEQQDQINRNRAARVSG